MTERPLVPFLTGLCYAVTQFVFSCPGEHLKGTGSCQLALRKRYAKVDAESRTSDVSFRKLKQLLEKKERLSTLLIFET